MNRLSIVMYILHQPRLIVKPELLREPISLSVDVFAERAGMREFSATVMILCC
jgi:hypothetical protein